MGGCAGQQELGRRSESPESAQAMSGAEGGGRRNPESQILHGAVPSSILWETQVYLGLCWCCSWKRNQKNPGSIQPWSPSEFPSFPWDHDFKYTVSHGTQGWEQKRSPTDVEDSCSDQGTNFHPGSPLSPPQQPGLWPCRHFSW